MGSVLRLGSPVSGMRSKFLVLMSAIDFFFNSFVAIMTAIHSIHRAAMFEEKRCRCFRFSIRIRLKIDKIYLMQPCKLFEVDLYKNRVLDRVLRP